jgi:FixJ family two-component response regulator
VLHAAGALIVYIVDDDAAVRSSMARLMRSAGHEPRVFESGEAFLAQLGEGGRGCLLLDITLPRMTGLKVQAQLRQRGGDLPVIAVSARDDEETLRQARELGVRLYLHKPVDDRALLDAIDWVTGAGGG